jgi:hypothetical protein
VNDTWFQLEQFIREVRAPSLLGLDEKLTREMDLYHDLDWEPKRIVEIVNTWAERFRADLRSFDVSYYVPSAKVRTGEVLLTALKSPFGASAREALGGRSLTLGMMEESMKRGYWQVDAE